MEQDSPPSSRVRAPAGPSVAAARGALREALAALHNLAQLLQSLRVAPRSLGPVVPDVLEACMPIRSSVATLLSDLSEHEGASEAAEELRGFVSARLEPLEERLRQTALRPINAKARLSLEEAVAKSAFELDAARHLIQLLEDAASGRRVRVDPRELVRQAFTVHAAEHQPGATLVSATLSSFQANQEILIDPRVTMALIGFGVELVDAQGGPGTPHVLVSGDDALCRVSIDRQVHATGEPLVLVSRGLIEPTLPCVLVAARLSGGSLEWDADRRAFLLTYRPAEDSRRTDLVG